jgi:hypothetical protein
VAVPARELAARTPGRNARAATVPPPPGAVAARAAQDSARPRCCGVYASISEHKMIGPRSSVHLCEARVASECAGCAHGSGRIFDLTGPTATRVNSSTTFRIRNGPPSRVRPRMKSYDQTWCGESAGRFRLACSAVPSARCPRSSTQQDLLASTASPADSWTIVAAAHRLAIALHFETGRPMRHRLGPQASRRHCCERRGFSPSGLFVRLWQTTCVRLLSQL